MNNFVPGEIAILRNCVNTSANGTECLVIHSPRIVRSNVTGPWAEGKGVVIERSVGSGKYVIEHEGYIWWVWPEQLLKRPGEKSFTQGEADLLAPPLDFRCGEWDLLPMMPWRKKRKISMPG